MSNSRKMLFGRYDYAAFSSLFTYACRFSSNTSRSGVSRQRDGLSVLEEGRFLGRRGSRPWHGRYQLSLPCCSRDFSAGKYGKRKTVGYSALLMGLGIIICAFAPSYGVVFTSMAIAGLGEGTIEGLATPFVNDLHREEAGRYVNVAHSFWSVGVLFTVIISGFLLTLGVDWRYMVFGTGVLALIPTLLLLLPEQPGKKYPEHPDPIHWKTNKLTGVINNAPQTFLDIFCGDVCRRWRRIQPDLLECKLYSAHLHRRRLDRWRRYRYFCCRYDNWTNVRWLYHPPETPARFHNVRRYSRSSLNRALPDNQQYLDLYGRTVCLRYSLSAILAKHPDLRCRPDAGRRLNHDVYPSFLRRDSGMWFFHLAARLYQHSSGQHHRFFLSHTRVLYPYIYLYRH